MSKTAELVIRFYQLLDGAKHSILISAFGYSSVCKHRPTCSEYCRQQVVQHGTITGFYRGARRFLMCW